MASEVVGSSSGVDEGETWPGMPSRSKEEREAWEKQRQRREKLSSLMGQYLLKGYRMLGTNCSDCGNILLQTHQGSTYCVQCSELGQEGTPLDQQTLTKPLPRNPDNQHAAQPRAPAVDKSIGDSKCTGHPPPNEWCVGLEEKLVAKMQWASTELASCPSVEESTQLCVLIKAGAEALRSVRELERDERDKDRLKPS